jgi:hypothetical protein
LLKLTKILQFDHKVTQKNVRLKFNFQQQQQQQQQQQDFFSSTV